MRNPIVIAMALVVALAAPAYAQSSNELTQADVDRALAERTAAANSLAETTARFEVAVADEDLSRERIEKLAKSIASLELDISDMQREVLEIVQNRYMNGAPNGAERLFAAGTFQDLPVQSEYYQLVGESDLSKLRGLEAVEALYEQQQKTLDETLAEQVALVAEISVLRDEIFQTLEDADEAYNKVATAYAVQEEKKRIAEEERLKREAEQRAAAAAAAAATTTTAPPTKNTGGTTTTTKPPTTTTTAAPTTTTTTVPSAPPPVVTSDKTCPVNAATTFSDSWGANRSGGRSHKGVDMMARRNAPLVAIESGRIKRTSNSTLGGISIYLTGTSGAEYYYAHLEGLASGVKGGLTVNVGDVIGYVGTTGNAPDNVPHLHFQYAPPGSDWINPYPLVKGLCG